MNNRDKIRNIFSDKSLSNSEKSRRVQNILNNKTNELEGSKLVTQLQENKLENKKVLPYQYIDEDCNHYERKCLSYCKICKQYFKCRLCHDQIISGHTMNRFNINRSICGKCHFIQSPINKCRFCKIQFSEYFCDRCNLWTNDDSVWHCDKCGICRKGGKENFFHCDTCNLCLINSKKNTLKYQLINIENKDGYFKIVYNNWKSDKLSYDVTDKKLKKNLDKIPNIGKIKVEKIKDVAYVIHFIEKEEHQLQLLKVETYNNCQVEISIFKRHICVNNTSDSNCPVCGEHMFGSTESLHISSCGHSMHAKCFSECIQNKKYRCPLCRKMMINLTQHWKYLENLIAETNMPEEYQFWKTDILCNDCLHKSQTKFHFHGHQCIECKSFNTNIIKIHKYGTHMIN